MISRRTLYSACIALNLGLITPALQANVLQSLCRPFSWASTQIQKRPVLAAIVGLAIITLSTKIYSLWVKKTNHQKMINVFDQRICSLVKAKKTFNNAKQLIANNSATPKQIFYEQLNSLLPQVRSALNPKQQAQLDALKFYSISKGSVEYWNACAQLVFYLNDYIHHADETLKTLVPERLTLTQSHSS